MEAMRTARRRLRCHERQFQVEAMTAKVPTARRAVGPLPPFLRTAYLISFHVIRAIAQGRCPEDVVEGRSEGRSVQAIGPAQTNTNAIFGFVIGNHSLGEINPCPNFADAKQHTVMPGMVSVPNRPRNRSGRSAGTEVHHEGERPHDGTKTSGAPDDGRPGRDPLQ